MARADSKRTPESKAATMARRARRQEKYAARELDFSTLTSELTTATVSA